MKKVIIQPGCISCTSCVFHAPEIFEVITTSRVKEDAPLAAHADAIRTAAAACPVQVIHYEQE